MIQICRQQKKNAKKFSMKKYLLIVFVFACLFSFGQKNDARFSSLFGEYIKNNQAVFVLYISGTEGLKHYNVIIKNNKGWERIDYYKAELLGFTDSSVRKKCMQCSTLQQVLNENALLKLPEKTDSLERVCKSTKDTIVNGQKASIINEFSAEADNARYVLEYLYMHKQKRLLFKDPFAAKSICPDVVLWKKYYEIFHAIQTFK
jgi:hypothetical protein